MPLLRFFIHIGTLLQQLGIQVGMAFCRGYKADGTVTMFMVVLLDKHADPPPGGKEAFKRLASISWPVFHSLE